MITAIQSLIIFLTLILLYLGESIVCLPLSLLPFYFHLRETKPKSLPYQILFGLILCLMAINAFGIYLPYQVPMLTRDFIFCLLAIVIPYYSVQNFTDKLRAHIHLNKPGSAAPFKDHHTLSLSYDQLHTKLTEKIQTDSSQNLYIIQVVLAGLEDIYKIYGADETHHLMNSFYESIRNILPIHSHISHFSETEYHIIINDMEQDNFQRVTHQLKEMNAEFNLQLKGFSKLKIFIGAAHYPSDSDVPRDLINFANTAQTYAQDHGEKEVQLFRRDMQKKALRALQIQTQFQKALKNNEFELHYQPKIRTKDQVITGIEALIRWKSSKLGFVPPNEFIPIAESNGFIITLGRFIIEESILHVKKLNDLNYFTITLSINVSPIQFLEDDLPEYISDLLKLHQVKPQQIEIEITEGMILESNEKVKNQIFALKELGLGLALDDFGTGYASLSYLTQYPFTSLKIDRSFVDKILENDDLKVIVKNSIQLGNDLQLETIAEGVETQQQLDFFTATNCDTIQGWYFAKAMNSKDFVEYLRQFQNPDRY